MSDMDDEMEMDAEMEAEVSEPVAAPMQGIPADTGSVDYAAAISTEQTHHDRGPGGATGARLRSFIERIERLEEEKKGIMDDMKEVFAEAKSDGFDVKIMRQILKIRKMDDADRAEQEALLETYMSAIGM
ncbi:DUF2312 domain-containing protein [Curvivirga sp.]|uniref:DUF2312 domain-containing protein n=1 Tax=Curvivirga sp. TaxID=2856848 RepID=UPI003B5A587B